MACFFLSLLFISTGYASSFVLDQQTDTNVMQVLVQLQTDVNNMKTKMSEFDESCACSATKIHKQAFMTSLGHDFTCALNQAVVFDIVKLNQGSGYDNRHGLFRASQNGTYHFSATLTAAPQTHFHVAFVKNVASNHVGYAFADGGLSFWQEKTVSILIHLNSDDVWLSCLNSNSKMSGDTNTVNDFHKYHSHFSGYMVYED